MNEYSSPVNFIDLAAQQKTIRSPIDAAIAKVLDHGQYIMGPEVREFENALLEFTGASYALTCANGTDALSLVLMAWGIGPGDAVFFDHYDLHRTAFGQSDCHHRYAVESWFFSWSNAPENQHPLIF